MFGTQFHFKFAAATRRRRAFTLVEMLAVMAIIALMLLVTLPAFRGFNQAQGRRGAVGNLMGVLDRARMMAISDGLPTYVVFARKPIRDGTPVNPKLWGQAYAIFQDKDDINFGIVQRTPWLYLPIGIALKMDATAPTGTDASATTTATTASVTDQLLTTQGNDPVFPVTGPALSGSATSATGVLLPYWKFDNTGAVAIRSLDPQVASGSSTAEQQNDYLRVLLFTGYIDGGGREVSTQTQGGTGSATAATLEEIDVNPVTGRAQYVVNASNNLAVQPTPAPTPGS